MKLKMITAPDTMPVSLIEAKAFYRVIGSDEDVDITRTINAATEKAEQITNRQMKVATYEGYLDSFPVSVDIPKPPLVSVTKIEYIDVDGATVPWTDYTVDDIVEPAVIYFNSTPEDVETEGVNNVIITFDSGYVTTPQALQSWILIYGATLYENRENLTIGVSVDGSIKAYYDHLLDSYRIIPV